MDNKKFISKIKARNIGPFKNLIVDLGPGTNVIIGANSSGKSSILKTIAMCFGTNFQDFRLDSSSAMATTVSMPNETKVIGLGTNSFSKVSSYRGASLQEFRSPQELLDSPAHLSSATTSGHLANDTNFTFAPLAIGPNRSIKYLQIAGMTREREKPKQITHFRQKMMENLQNGKVPSPKQWMVNRYYQIDKDWALHFRSNFDTVLKNLQIIGPKSSSFSFLKIEQDLEPQFSLNGNTVYLEELSSGFQSILAIVFSIIDWIEAVNDGEARKIENAEGSVLIDEIEAHLHPEWQQTILSSLRTLFPKIQFIITTHSPHVAGSCGPGELIVLPKHDGNVNIKPNSNAFNGWALENLLISLMGLDDVRGEAFNRLYERAQRAIRDRNEDDLEKVLEELTPIISPDDPTPSILRLSLANEKLKVCRASS